MAEQFVSIGYGDEALDRAVYDKLDDGAFAGRLPECPGAVAFGESLRGCELELRSTLEDWLLVGLRAGCVLSGMPLVDGAR